MLIGHRTKVLTLEPGSRHFFAESHPAQAVNCLPASESLKSARFWPLAQFYFNETRSHIQWFIKKSPVRSQGPEREEVNIEGIFEGIDTSSLADVKAAIEKKDSVRISK